MFDSKFPIRRFSPSSTCLDLVMVIEHHNDPVARHPYTTDASLLTPDKCKHVPYGHRLHSTVPNRDKLHETIVGGHRHVAGHAAVGAGQAAQVDVVAIRDQDVGRALRIRHAQERLLLPVGEFPLDQHAVLRQVARPDGHTTLPRDVCVRVVRWDIADRHTVGTPPCGTAVRTTRLRERLVPSRHCCHSRTRRRTADHSQRHQSPVRC